MSENKKLRKKGIKRWIAVLIVLSVAFIGISSVSKMVVAKTKRPDFDTRKVKITSTTKKVKLTWPKQKDVSGYEVKKRIFGVTKLKKRNSMLDYRYWEI